MTRTPMTQGTQGTPVTRGTPVTLATAGTDPALPTLPTSRPGDAPDAFHVLAKPSGPICNLDCRYCYFLEKEALYPGDRFRMAPETLERYVRQVIESHDGPEVTVAWQGGEPTLMGLDFFGRAMALVERYRRPGQVVSHTIQTNGTLLTDEWCAFLAEHHYLVGISIDGPRALHDAYRVDKRGRPTFDRVMTGLGRLQAHGVDVNVLCTVHAANQDHPLEVYRFFRDDLGLRHLQLIPIVERADAVGGGGDAVTDRSVDPDAWGRFLVAVFDEWLVRDVGQVFVSHFDAALASWLGVRPGLCIFGETCGDAVALEHNGDVYACDHFVDPEHLVGNINQTHLVELLASKPQREFGLAKRDTLPGICRRCPVRFACNGECPKNRFATTPEGEPGLNYLCAGYLAFFTHVDGAMRMMADLLRRGRYADEVMAVFAAARRNDPCPCGSGRKAKHCHRRDG
ncbi:MAG TPA: anaerobic sulfatase maturase [Acidimicrobiales bacterium]|nr:anaerobic sulfatase maturase [Acidimicrobiales bacterium]